MNISICIANKNYLINNYTEQMTLRDVCAINDIPCESVSFYYINKDEGYKILTGLNKQIFSLKEITDHLIIRPDRNINYLDLKRKPLKIKKTENASSEYTFANSSENILEHYELTPSDCKEFICAKVKEFIKDDVLKLTDKPIVMGISGGGDSNNLIRSFLESGLIDKSQLIAVMMLGVPDWDLGKGRAEAICREYDIPLRFVDSNQVNNLLGRTKQTDWVTDFEKSFPEVDLEVLGTLAVRLSLSSVARELNAQAIVIGLNLEDLLAESFLQVCKGKLPLPYPVRVIDDIQVWYPLYQCPKKILDGSYPKYSLDNYLDRYPSKLIGCAVPYYLAQMVHSVLPGAEYDLLNGFKRLSHTNKDYGLFDSDIGFSILEFLPLKDRKKWNEFKGVKEQLYNDAQ